MLSLLKRLPPTAGILLTVALALFTTHKLYTMCRIRGFVGERRIEVHYVTDKTVEHGEEDRTFCFVSWAEDPSAHDPRQRVQADCDYWEKLRPDDRIELVRLGEGSQTYLRGGDPYASDGNFMFDLVLLGGELAGIFYFWSRKRREDSGG